MNVKKDLLREMWVHVGKELNSKKCLGSIERD